MPKKRPAETTEIKKRSVEMTDIKKRSAGTTDTAAVVTTIEQYFMATAGPVS